jgi:hypothetical protein
MSYAIVQQVQVLETTSCRNAGKVEPYASRSYVHRAAPLSVVTKVLYKYMLLQNIYLLSICLQSFFNNIHFLALFESSK